MQFTGFTTDTVQVHTRISKEHKKQIALVAKTYGVTEGMVFNSILAEGLKAAVQEEEDTMAKKKVTKKATKKASKKMC